MNPTAKKTIIYAYQLKQKCDTGCAPCIYDRDGNPTGILSLACCKGGYIRYEGLNNEQEIRTGLRYWIGMDYGREIEDGRVACYVFGIYQKMLLYFAKITEIITMADYFVPGSHYKNRYDNIYDFLQDKHDFERNGNNKKFHSKKETSQHTKDWLGEYVLISNCFAYFGRESKPISQDTLDILLETCRKREPYHGDSPVGKQIMDEVRKRWNFKDIIQGVPHDYNQVCNSKGCGKSESHPVPKRVRHC